MKKTLKQRILHAAWRESVVNSRVLRRRLRIPRTERSTEHFDSTVMRTVRKLREDKLLARTKCGNYKLTSKGLRELEG